MLQERAAPFFSNYYSTAVERQQQLNVALSKLADGPLIATTFNQGFKDLFLNWVASCDHAAIPVRDASLIFPTDQAAHDVALAQGFQSVYVPSGLGDIPVESAEAYSDAIFVANMFANNAAVQIALTTGRDVLFQDIDIVWLKDPRPDLLKAQSDFSFMYDGPNPRFEPMHLNSGFFFIRSNERTRQIWDLIFESYPYILAWKSQQLLVNRVLHAAIPHGLTVERLSEQKFANGHLVPLPKPKGFRFSDATAVVHVSWTQNHEKKLEKLKAYDLWFLD